jgi:hypothetical protein
MIVPDMLEHLRHVPGLLTVGNYVVIGSQIAIVRDACTMLKQLA